MGRRRRKHEEHPNHEAWAIPYADLLTLLLAFFVVMYAISQVNEGKYRVLSDSLVAAFQGAPRTLEPVQVGAKQVGSGSDIKMTVVQAETLVGQPRQMLEAVSIVNDGPRRNGPKTAQRDGVPLPSAGDDAAQARLPQVADEVEAAMQDLVRDKKVVVRRYKNRVEVEIRTDILFQSGSASLAPHAVEVIERLSDALRQFPNALRIEGHTDNVPIRTVAFRSNWELSAARAATVVLLMSQRGIQPTRLAVLGFGEFRPADSNATAEGRNVNRRVLLVVTGVDGTVSLDGDSPLEDSTDDRVEPAPPTQTATGPSSAPPIARTDPRTAPNVAPVTFDARSPLDAPRDGGTAP